MDSFHEQLTPAYKSKLYDIYGFLIVCAILLFILGTTNLILAVAAVGLGVLFFFLRQKEYVEFEYSFTNGDVDIDIIMAASKRKKLISFDAKTIVAMAPEGSYHLDGTPAGKKVIAYPKNTKERVYIAVIQKGAEVKRVHFIPDQEFITYLFKSNPRNVKRE